MQLDTLRQLWEQTLGTPPMLEQFGLWSALHAEDVIKQAILRTARKNIDLGGTMTPEYKVRFASRVMIVQTQRNTSNAANREKLKGEFAARETRQEATGTEVGVESTRGSGECTNG